MSIDQIELSGRYVRLEALVKKHVRPLAEAARGNQELFKWTFVPQELPGMDEYVDRAIAGAQEGSMSAFAIVDVRDGRVLGSTRFLNIQVWNWPQGTERFGRTLPDVCEIGHTWLTSAAIRTPINTEAKLLLLTHAFENWESLRVCFQTDVRNLRSRAAIERIGGKFEGIARAERLASDSTVRDTARFSITCGEWPDVKKRLETRIY